MVGREESVAFTTRRIFKSKDGFTLLETLVALAILTIGIASVLHVFSTGLKTTKESESYSTATILANQVATQLEADTSVEAGDQSGTFDDETKYSWTANISNPDDNNLMRTTIAVIWNEGNNQREYDMVIYLYKSSSVTSTSSRTT